MQQRGISVNASCTEEREHDKTPMDAWHWKYIGKYEFWGDGNASAGIKPWCLKGKFSGATTTGYPTRRALKPSREGYCLWIGQDYQASPTWILVLTQEFTGSQDFCQSLCEKISVKKASGFPRFSKILPGALPPCPSKIRASVPQLPSGLGDF